MVTRLHSPRGNLHGVEAYSPNGGERSADSPVAPIYAGGLEIIPDAHTALANGKPMKLTAREFQVLTVLAGSPERVLTREVLYAEVWGGAYSRRDRSVDVYVGRVRSKLAEVLPGRNFIHTHTGIGYRFSPTGD